MNTGFILFIVAGAITIIGGYGLILRPMIKLPILSSADRFAIIGFVLVVYIFILSLIAKSGYSWATGVEGGTFWTQGDGARLIYESRTILGYAETVAVAAAGVFLPLLILLWNNAREKVSGTLEKFVTLKVEVARQQRLKEIICSAYDDLNYLREVGKHLGGIFWVTIIAVALYSTLLAYANFTLWEPYQAYILAVTLKAMAVALFLWLLAFLIIYLILVQPVLRDTAYSTLFEIEKLKSEGDPICPQQTSGQ